jgi:hypothetical protein
MEAPALADRLKNDACSRAETTPKITSINNWVPSSTKRITKSRDEEARTSTEGKGDKGEEEAL